MYFICLTIRFKAEGEGSPFRLSDGSQLSTVSAELVVPNDEMCARVRAYACVVVVVV